MINPPPELLMQIANDPRVESFVNSFPQVRSSVTCYLEKAGYRIENFERMLDFGCGLGRFLFAMRESARPGRLSGCDIDARCAEWCATAIDFAEVKHTSLDPPLPYDDETFDFVYALSVFTHLSLPLQMAWAREIARVMKPGGVLFVSTHGLMFLKLILAIRESWATAEISMFGADALVGVFGEGKGRAIEGQRETAAVHSGDAVSAIFSGFDLKYQEAVSSMAGGQSVSIFEKRRGLSKPVVPLGSPQSSEGIAANQASSGVRRFSFPRLPCAAMLRFCLVFDEPRRDCSRFTVHCRVSAQAGADRPEHRLALPVPTTSGRNHFLPFAVPVQIVDSNLEIDLQLVAAQGGPVQAPFAFEWRFVRIEA